MRDALMAGSNELTALTVDLAYDQKHIARIGNLHDCIAYGPGTLDLAHQPDEYVGIDDMVASAKVMALAGLRLVGMDASR